MTRLALPQVSLVAIDTRAPALAAESLLRSMAGVDFGRVMLFTRGWLPNRVVPGLEVLDIDPIATAADYSNFVLRRLAAYVRTSHVLVTQWDGFVVEPAAWNDEFLVYDYIGPVWPDQPADRSVGNGGFSLRSRRLLVAGQDRRIAQEHPEDEVLCRTYRELLEREHGVRFAPPALARRFAFENDAPSWPTFGFHGPYHLPRVLDEATLARWLEALPDAFFLGRDARRMARSLMTHGMAGTARRLLERRHAAGSTDPKTRVLGVAAAWMDRVLGAPARSPRS